MMAKPYVYRGDARDYHWLGHVEDGAIAYFENMPPDTRWTTADSVPADAPVVDEFRVQRQDEEITTAEKAAAEVELRQPNRAAPAEDWKTYAVADGGFQAATGVHPNDATRKAIVDHYTEQPAHTPQAPTDTPDTAVHAVSGDAPKE